MLLEKNTDEFGAAAALTPCVAASDLEAKQAAPAEAGTQDRGDRCDDAFEELERAFFAAGEVEPEPPAPLDPELEAEPAPERAPNRILNTTRVWLAIGLRLLTNALRGHLGMFPSALERLSPLRFARPLLVRIEDQPPPGLYKRRPGLTVAAAVVLTSTLASLWAGVVLAASKLG